VCCWQDVDKCIAIMKELENVEMSANLLLKNSDIVTTIRRVMCVNIDICALLDKSCNIT